MSFRMIQRPMPIQAPEKSSPAAEMIARGAGQQGPLSSIQSPSVSPGLDRVNDARTVPLVHRYADPAVSHRGQGRLQSLVESATPFTTFRVCSSAGGNGMIKRVDLASATAASWPPAGAGWPRQDARPEVTGLLCLSPDAERLPGEGASRDYFTLICSGGTEREKSGSARPEGRAGRGGNAVWFCHDHMAIAREHENRHCSDALAAINAQLKASGGRQAGAVLTRGPPRRWPPGSARHEGFS
jgi:hypothetical protein